MPHGVEPKALVVGPWLVLVGGREGLWIYFTKHTEIGADGLPQQKWRRFSIAAHHNQFFQGTEQEFSAATVDGTGGDSETTGYMGATLSADEQGIIICYDRTVSHAWQKKLTGRMSSAANEMHRGTTARSARAMHFNTVYCFRADPPSVALT